MTVDDADDAAEAEREDVHPSEDEHLSDVEAGAGCTEIWEHLSERRCADD